MSNLTKFKDKFEITVRFVMVANECKMPILHRHVVAANVRFTECIRFSM